jgi:hypothetical protein
VRAGPGSAAKAGQIGQKRAPGGNSRRPRLLSRCRHVAISATSGAAGAFSPCPGLAGFPARYVPGVVTRPFTSERAAASPGVPSACVTPSSSGDSVAFFASAVALA